MMIKTDKELKLTPSHIKILKTISLLNSKHLYPLPEGVGNILKGKVDLETNQYQDLLTYSTLLSFSSKKICRYILMLQRYGYLDKIYDKKTDNLYLRTTEKGEAILFDYLKKHKNIFKKKSGVNKTLIVKI